MGVSTAQSDDEPVDGRNLRAARSRQQIVDAFLDLLAEGEAHPTVQLVSDRSGVSMSTVWRLFEDVESLHSVATTIQIGRVSPLLVAVDPNGPLEDRVKRLVESRAKLFEAITPIRRFSARLASSSEPIRAQLQLGNAFLRTQVADVFEAEISRLGAEALEVADALTSWDVWERFRSAQGLTVRRAKAAISTSLLSLLRER